MDDYDNAREILKVYLKNSTAIHVTKNDGMWMNGSIVEVRADFVLIDEFKKGRMPVFFLEIKSIEPYAQRGEEIGSP